MNLKYLQLLDACVINCGKQFHLEVASRDFETEFKKLLSKYDHPIPLKLKLVLKKWAESDFKDDPQLDLIPSMYLKLKSEGHDFTDSTFSPKLNIINKDPNVVTSQQEEDDIAKAIELSLKETGGVGNKNFSKNINQSTSLYPIVSLRPSISSNASEPRKVRALYDFEAVEDNEMTFAAGDIIHVLDDSDQNWWKGYSKDGAEGLFPSNFVTADLSVEPETLSRPTDHSKKVKFFNQRKEKKSDVQLEVDENKIDRLLHLLNEANPEDPSQDPDEIQILENQVNQMGPLIDAELERVDRKNAQLTQLSGELVDAINLYHTLMRESDRPMIIPYTRTDYQNTEIYGVNNLMMPNTYNDNIASIGLYSRADSDLLNPGAHGHSEIERNPFYIINNQENFNNMSSTPSLVVEKQSGGVKMLPQSYVPQQINSYHRMIPQQMQINEPFHHQIQHIHPDNFHQQMLPLPTEQTFTVLPNHSGFPPHTSNHVNGSSNMQNHKDQYFIDEPSSQLILHAVAPQQNIVDNIPKHLHQEQK